MNDLLTVSEVARIFRVDDTTVRRWVKQGASEEGCQRPMSTSAAGPIVSSVIH